MGVKINAQEQSEMEFVRTIYRETEIILKRIKSPWLWPEVLFRLSPVGREDKKILGILHGFTEKVIKDRKADFLEKKSTEGEEMNSSSESSNYGMFLSKKKRRIAFLDMLLEAADSNPSLTSSSIQEEVDTFMFEGHDTTASGAIWILYMLACHPALQIKVQEEMDTILGESARDVTMEDINKLEYTSRFIKETFRLYPPVPWFGRLTSEPCQIGGYSIPAGTSVNILNHVLHRDPEYFPDPERFDPDRWLDDQASRHPYCYTPFSAGPRNCIGQRFALLEEKVILCHVMRHFNVTTRIKRDDIIPMATLILKPANAVPVQLTGRK